MPAAPHWPLLTLLAAAALGSIRRRSAPDRVERAVATVVDRDPPLTATGPEKIAHSYAYVGCTDGEIGNRLGLTEDEVDIRFGPALAVARAQRIFALRRAQMDLAVEIKQCQMLIWLGRNELGQTLDPAIAGLGEPALPMDEREAALVRQEGG